MLYRYAARGFAAGDSYQERHGDDEQRKMLDTLTPLGRGIMEPAHLGNRPDIQGLLEAEEAAAAATA